MSSIEGARGARKRHAPEPKIITYVVMIQDYKYAFFSTLEGALEYRKKLCKDWYEDWDNEGNGEEKPESLDKFIQLVSSWFPPEKSFWEGAVRIYAADMIDSGEPISDISEVTRDTGRKTY